MDKSQLRRLSYQAGSNPNYQNRVSYEKDKTNLLERLECYLKEGWVLDSQEISNVIILLRQSIWQGEQ